MGAGNQQERPDPGWVVGFVDGEGTFSVSVFRNVTTSSGWQVFPEFVVTQGERSATVLQDLESFFGCGSVYRNRRRDNHSCDIYRYCVRRRRDLIDRIIPFFERHPLRTSKREDFESFRCVLGLMEEGHHLTPGGLESIRGVVAGMNTRRQPRHPESSETVRQTSAAG